MGPTAWLLQQVKCKKKKREEEENLQVKTLRRHHQIKKGRVKNKPESREAHVGDSYREM